MKTKSRWSTFGAAAIAVGAGVVAIGCISSPWKVQGPKDCMVMCMKWDLEFAGMVGVGDQDSANAMTGCVCQVKGAKPPPPAPTGSAPSASTVAPITPGEAMMAVHLAKL